MRPNGIFDIFPSTKNDFSTSLPLLLHEWLFEMLVNDLLLCYVKKELRSNRTKANHATSQKMRMGKHYDSTK